MGSLFISEILEFSFKTLSHEFFAKSNLNIWSRENEAKKEFQETMKASISDLGPLLSVKSAIDILT